MDTAIAIIIILVAAYFVYKKVRGQLNAKEGSGCGCSGGCSSGSEIDSGSCCLGKNHHPADDKG